MCAKLAALQQLNFCYVPRFITNSNVHEAFSPSINVHAQKIISGKKWNREKVKDISVWGSKTFLNKKYVHLSHQSQKRTH